MNRSVAAKALAAVGVIASAVTASPIASAREGGTFVETRSSDAIVCRTTTTDDLYKVQAAVFRSDQGDNFFLMQVFENFGNVELVEEAYGWPEWSEGAVRAVGSLYDPAGEPLSGESTMAAVYAVSGEATTTTGRTQQGNQRIVAETTITPFILDSVSIVVPGYDLNSLDCTASSVTQTLTYTTPAEFVDVTRSFEINPDISCYFDEYSEVSAEAVGRDLSILIRNLPGPLADAIGHLHLNGATASGSLNLVDDEGAAAGTAITSAKLTQVGPTVADSFAEGDFFLAQRSTPFQLDLTIELPEGPRTVSCHMDKVTQRVRVDLPK